MITYCIAVWGEFTKFIGGRGGLAHWLMFGAALLCCILMGKSNEDIIKRYKNFLMDGKEDKEDDSIYTKYDYCIIDWGRDISISVINALVASDDVIIPVTIDEFAFDGICEILVQIGEIKKYYNANLNFAGCLVTQYRNDEFHEEGIRALKQMCGSVFDTKIRWTQMVSKSTFVREPVSVYSPRCGAARTYKAFVDEYRKRAENHG